MRGPLRQFGKALRSFPYLYSSDWVTEHESTWRAALAPFIGRPSVRYLEIGVFQGRSAVWMLKNVLTHPTSTMVAVDTFQFASRRLLSWNLLVAGQLGRVRVLEGRSRDVLPGLAGERFDFIYVDGCHRAAEVSEDLEASWRMLAPRGVLLIDDYLNEGLAPEDRPKAAIDGFLASRRAELEVLETGWQVIVRRR